MTIPKTAAPASKRTSSLYQALRILGFVTLLLIVVAILYAGWIAIANWGDIRV